MHSHFKSKPKLKISRILNSLSKKFLEAGSRGDHVKFAYRAPLNRGEFCFDLVCHFVGGG